MPTFFDGDLVFVHIPKCAGISVRSALANYQLSEGLGDPSWYRAHESLFEIQTNFVEKWGTEKWENTTIISTVRHPVDRAVSWWKFRKKINMMNFQESSTLKPEEEQVFNVTSAVHPYITPEDYAKYHRKVCSCRHEVEEPHVEEFDGLSFHDYIGRMTIWKESGCENPNCPYHMLPPQIRWLNDASGKVRMDRLNLFLVDRLNELEDFLPDMPIIYHHNVSRKDKEDYREHLSTESLMLLNGLYGEDFKIYDTLSGDSSKRNPIRFSTNHTRKEEQ